MSIQMRSEVSKIPNLFQTTNTEPVLPSHQLFIRVEGSEKECKAVLALFHEFLDKKGGRREIS